MSSQAAELRYAVRFPVLFRYFGKLCMVVAALTLVPMLVSLFYGEFRISLRYGTVILVAAALGAGMGRLQGVERVQVNEAMVLVASLFFFTPLMMTIPIMGADLSFADAFFESVSGATTTGLTMVRSLDRMPDSFLFARAWMQWYGGLGIVVLSLALILRPGTPAMDLAVTESRDDDLVGGTKSHALVVLRVYCLMTVGGILLLILLGVRPFNAVLYTLSAVSTGGFAPDDSSMGALGTRTIQAAVILICVAGAVPLISYHRWFREPARRSADLHHMFTVVGCGLVIMILLGICIWLSPSRFEIRQAHHVPLLAFSAQTTAGFSSTDPAALNAGSKLVLILAMMVGGGVGSTAGGFKAMRLLVAMRLTYMLIIKTSLARNAVVSTRLGNKRLESESIQEAVTIIFLFLSVIAFSWLAFVVAGYDPLDSLFEVVSATGTVGLSVGITGTELPALLKGVLCADMLMGRLEIVAWLVFLYPGTWIGRRF